MKKLYIIAVVIIIAGLTACNDKTLDEPPNISITSDDTLIEDIVGLNKWDGSVYDRKDTLHTIMTGNSDIYIPYLKLGEKITIEFNGSYPDTTRLYDYILDGNGNEKYTSKVVKEIPIEIVDGKGSFILNINYAAFLSSNSKDYEPGASTRGFKLICTWGENECEYGFIIRSDAH